MLGEILSTVDGYRDLLVVYECCFAAGFDLIYFREVKLKGLSLIRRLAFHHQEVLVPDLGHVVLTVCAEVRDLLALHHFNFSLTHS